jgi:DNA polymerase-3 subunit alpha
MAEELGDEDYGILRWAVDNVASVKIAYKWYQPLFAQAMRIEGTKRNQSKHAAGIIIADNPIEHYAPMAYDVRTKTRMCALEMAHAEKMGLVKFDFLGVVALDKIWGVQNMVNARAEIAT